MDEFRMQMTMIERDLIADMFKPVRCTCGQVYDIGKVEITGRYTDCTVWRTPCCDRSVDDRCEYAPGWTSRQDYTVIDKSNPYPNDIYGGMW